MALHRWWVRSIALQNCTPVESGASSVLVHVTQAMHHTSKRCNGPSWMLLAPICVSRAVGCTYMIVRRLARPLRSAERRRVRDFASASIGLSLHSHANILMASSIKAARTTCLSSLFGPKIER